MQLKNWKMAIAAAVAGVAGTSVFDLLGLLMMGGWDVPNALAGTLGTPLVVGAGFHYGIGITLAVIFAALLPLFPGPLWFRGVTFMTVQTILGVWLFMLPMMGMGIAGIESPMGITLGLLSLVRHWVFGIVVAVVYAQLVPRMADAREGAQAGKAVPA
ncbi:MAG: hypothetical protein WD960_13910 [Gemmatimonadota bacterium]